MGPIGPKLAAGQTAGGRQRLSSGRRADGAQTAGGGLGRLSQIG